MRDIKFRIWDGEKFYYSDNEQNKQVEIAITNNGLVANAWSQSGEWLKQINIIGSMQYTGLKDKNGVEVYEGDIVRCSSGCPHTVEYIQEQGGTYFGGMPTFYLSGLNKGYAWSGKEEIIGNIHDNPELLNSINNE